MRSEKRYCWNNLLLESKLDCGRKCEYAFDMTQLLHPKSRSSQCRKVSYIFLYLDMQTKKHLSHSTHWVQSCSTLRAKHQQLLLTHRHALLLENNVKKALGPQEITVVRQ
jgi:hypothetical protein